MSGPLREALASGRQTLEQTCPKLRMPVPAWIFPSSKTGGPMSALPLSRRFRDVRRAADLTRGLSLYALRHTFASHCLAAGERAVTVAKWLGHADVRTTYTFYAPCPAG